MCKASSCFVMQESNLNGPKLRERRSCVADWLTWQLDLILKHLPIYPYLYRHKWVGMWGLLTFTMFVLLLQQSAKDDTVMLIPWLSADQKWLLKRVGMVVRSLPHAQSLNCWSCSFELAEVGTVSPGLAFLIRFAYVLSCHVSSNNPREFERWEYSDQNIDIDTTVLYISTWSYVIIWYHITVWMYFCAACWIVALQKHAET